jgi:hypothetical protein
VSTIADLRPGMIGFGPLNGRPAKLLVDAGQLLLGEGFRVGRLNIEHVFMVVEIGSGPKPDIYAVEAMPSGARYALISNELSRWTPQYAYVQLPEDYPGQSADAAAIARAMIGTPYSFASYAALAAWRFGWKMPKLEAWIDRRKPPESMGNNTGMWRSLPREAICSVLADQSWALTGKQVMSKGTPHQCVTPGALAAAMLETEGAKWLWPA